ncbi:hypothetical protein FFK22_016850 [Mycobacterium sp. KBS0706]|uniref:hypothetical protein n=1 Tax=Mycobacterium sp. KBS0706 TaxID=2578109 RepID=UPI00110F7D38|nr:hypothetical protein [Mycobacterium sp. KBS0706]TSD87512.1 hypothetical protein FFK22_016850 [Mycobacterium sp. KBS0706]
MAPVAAKAAAGSFGFGHLAHRGVWLGGVAGATGGITARNAIALTIERVERRLIDVLERLRPRGEGAVFVLDEALVGGRQECRAARRKRCHSVVSLLVTAMDAE